MNINFTKIYRLWFILTTVSVVGALTTFFMGYDPVQNAWNYSIHNMHTLFIGILLAAVFIRLYMAFNKINAVPLMHLVNAKNSTDRVIALAYISMCSALLITLGSEIYFLSVPPEEHSLMIRTLRDTTQPIFAIMVTVHVFYVLYVNLVKKRGSLRKLIKASNL